MSVKMIVFNNGLQLVGNVTDADGAEGKITVEKPVSLIFIPQSENPRAQDKVGMAFTPFLQYVEEWTTGIKFSIADVLTVATPAAELLNNYNATFGSGIVVPGGIVR